MSKTIKDKDGHSLVEVYDTDEIVANPTLDGSEGSLAGLKIGDTKYKVTSGSGGGMILVDTLPEIGKEDTLYKTPDGKIWSCINTTTTETICDLEVGKSFKFKDKVTAGEITNLLSSVQGTVGLYFDEEGYNILNLEKNTYEYSRTTEYYIYYDEGDNDSIEYHCTSASLPEDLIEPTLDGFTEIPSVEITQYFVDMLEESFELSDVAFLFEGGTHTEEVTTSTWSEVGSSNGSGMQIVKVLNDESGVITLDKTTAEIFSMLQNGPVYISGYYQRYNVYYNSMITAGTFGDELYEFSIVQSQYGVQYNYQIEYDKEKDEWRFVTVE